MVTTIGMVGSSPGNGHPFSFSAIINGYDRCAFEKTEWQVILNYLDDQKKKNIGIADMKVTHAWNQDEEITAQLCSACRIPYAVTELDDLIGNVDAVIIARDDYENHYSIARRFLEAGQVVFIDKPLTLKKDELEYFKPFLLNGKLMSTSGMRYAVEMEHIKTSLIDIGDLVLIQAVILNDYAKYGIHMLDAIDGLGVGRIKKITRLHGNTESYSFTLDTGVLFNLNCLGSVDKTFHCGFYGEKGYVDCHLHDNFSAFKKTLLKFHQMIKDQRPPFPPDNLIHNMNVLRLGKSLSKGRSLEIGHG